MQRHPVQCLCLEAYEQRLEAVEPGVGVLDDGSSFEEFLVKIHIVLTASPVSGVKGDVCFYLHLRAQAPEALGVEPGVGVEEQPLRLDACFPQQPAQLPEHLFYLEQVMVGTRHRRTAGKQQPLAVGEEQAVAGFPSFTGLVAHMLPTLLAERLAAVQLHAREIQQPALALQKLRPGLPQAAVPGPLPEVVVHALPAQASPAEEFPYRQLTPLAARLEPVENG